MSDQSKGVGFDWRDVLRTKVWSEGAVHTVANASYRVRSVVTCYAEGRQTAEFANGMHNYGAYVELTRPDGSWIERGTGIVPVLPDGRLVMVIEQRPPQARLPNQPTHVLIGGKKVLLSDYGPYSSLEFPGGSIDPVDNTFTAGFLRELIEETGVKAGQTSSLYMRHPPIFSQGADIALEGFAGVIYLTSTRFSSFVPTDGGLEVFALSPEEVQENIWCGNIRSGQAALLGWSFYQEMERARKDSALHRKMFKSDYFSITEVEIKLP